LKSDKSDCFVGYFLFESDWVQWEAEEIEDQRVASWGYISIAPLTSNAGKEGSLIANTNTN